jgi:hypothetical protein
MSGGGVGGGGGGRAAAMDSSMAEADGQAVLVAGAGKGSLFGRVR